MNPKKDYARNARKYRTRFIDDCGKQNCRHYRGRKRGCKLDKCCRDDEKLDAIAAGRHK